MRYLTPEECKALGLRPHAVYGGNVHSYLAPEDRRIVAHGSEHYAIQVTAMDAWQEELEKLRKECHAKCQRPDALGKTWSDN